MSLPAGGRRPSAPAREQAGDGDRTRTAEASGGPVTLVPWSLAAARRLLVGDPPDPDDQARWHPDYPTADTVAVLATALAACEVDAPLASTPTWWAYEIRVDGQVVGDAGFHGPPAAEGPRVVEIGYGVVPALHGRGIATRACRLLLDRAWAAGADTVLADTDPDNPASRRVLDRCGFTARTGGGFGVDRPAPLPAAPTARGAG